MVAAASRGCPCCLRAREAPSRAACPSPDHPPAPSSPTPPPLQAIGDFQLEDYRLSASMNALNASQSAVVFAGLAAGMAVCTRASAGRAAGGGQWGEGKGAQGRGCEVGAKGGALSEAAHARPVGCMRELPKQPLGRSLCCFSAAGWASRAVSPFASSRYAASAACHALPSARAEPSARLSEPRVHARPLLPAGRGAWHAICGRRGPVRHAHAAALCSPQLLRDLLPHDPAGEGVTPWPLPKTHPWMLALALFPARPQASPSGPAGAHALPCTPCPAALCPAAPCPAALCPAALCLVRSACCPEHSISSTWQRPRACSLNQPALPLQLQSVIDMENMFDLLEQHPSIADAPGAVPLAPAGYSITFDNVGFQVSRRSCTSLRLLFLYLLACQPRTLSPAAGGASLTGVVQFPTACQVRAFVHICLFIP